MTNNPDETLPVEQVDRDAAVEQFECPHCRGEGVSCGLGLGIPLYPCRWCDGEGTVTEARAQDWGESDERTGA